VEGAPGYKYNPHETIKVIQFIIKAIRFREEEQL